MNIAVVGLWHLGCVTAACLANAGFDVFAYDSNEQIINSLKQGTPPLFEPGLETLIKNNVNNLTFSTELNSLEKTDIIWITYDTPVDDHDVADIAFVTNEIKKLFPYLPQNAVVLISSQVPVGTTRVLQQDCLAHYPDKKIVFACSPENLRLGKALDVFQHPDRVIIGIDSDQPDAKLKLEKLFKPFSQQLIWMSIESAEMTKHALNAFLATSVVFINELAILCERVGADAREVEKGLKTEERIGPKAYLRPGNAIAGGTLARDVNFLVQIGQKQQITTPLFSSLLTSNQAHKQWACRRVIDVLKDLKNKTIATLGLTYKAGTDTLRRSAAVESCEWFSQQGAKVVAYDPALKHLPDDISQFIHLLPTLKDAIKQADAIVISIEHPEFATLQANDLLLQGKPIYIFDPSGFLAKNLSEHTQINYFTVGRQS